MDLSTAYVDTYFRQEKGSQKYNLQYIYPRWDNKVELYIMVQTQFNEFSTTETELTKKANDGTTKFKYKLMKIFVGQFEYHEYDLAQQPTIYVPDESDMIYYS